MYKPHVLRRCLSSQGTSMYPRVHEGCWATVASSHNCETISRHYKSYYGTSHLYNGFLRCMGFVPSCSCMSSLGLRPRKDIQLPSGTNSIHLETHGTNITCTIMHLYMKCIAQGISAIHPSGSFELSIYPRVYGCQATNDTYNCPQSTNPIHARNSWYNYYLYTSVYLSIFVYTCV